MPTAIQRREFLRLSAMGAAAAVTAACTPAPSPTPPPATPAPASQPSPAAKAPAPTVAPTAAPTTAPIAVSAAQPTPVSKAASGKYREAPMLAELVKQGKLPPVEQRVPENPRVLQPLEEVGQYGGVWHRAYKGVSDRNGPIKLQEEYAIRWDTPDPNTVKVVANVVEKWEQNADATEFTWYLRKGMKWSDGADFTTDAVKFWWEDIITNKELAPNTPQVLQQRVGSEYKLVQVTIVDKHTFKFKYAQPFPLLPLQIAKGLDGQRMLRGFWAPGQYLKKYLPKYGNVDDLNKQAKDRKLQTWMDLWGKAGDMEGPISFWFLNPDAPVIFPWYMKTPSPADPIVMVRNPYYWKVDTQGNQLPYIDEIDHAFYDNDEVLKLWVAAGKIDFQQRGMSAGAYTFYKENEKKGNYRTFRWRAAETLAYFLNLNCPDKVLAKLFDTPEFRQALNLAVNRKEVNDLVWNGLGTPRQASPVRGSPEYDAEFEKKWTEYDPKTANDLLDKLGLKKGSDGVRTRPDGKPLEITIEHQSNTGDPANDMHELIKKYWSAIGVRASTKFVERSLYETRCHNGDMEAAYTGFNRSSVVKADPGRYLGTVDDGPWAPNYGHWYLNSPFKREEPPKDHPVRKMYELWDKVQTEPDDAKRNALFAEIINLHKQAPFVVGVVGEMAVPAIVGNSFRNYLDGFIADDTLRDEGMLNPSQYFIKKQG